MMVGNNELRLNEATMKEVLQYWIESKMVGTIPLVVGVDTTTDHYSKIFIIKLSDKQDVEKG